MFVRWTYLTTFTLFRGQFYLFCFSYGLFFSFASLSLSFRLSITTLCTNIIKLSRLYYSTTVHFYFSFSSSLLASIYMVSYFRIFSYFTVLIYLYATSRSNVTKLCTFIANRIFRTLLTFLLFWSYFLYTAFFLRDISIICCITIISNNYAILLYAFPLTLYLVLERFLSANIL